MPAHLSAHGLRLLTAHVVERPVGRFDFQGCHTFTVKNVNSNSAGEDMYGVKPIKSYVVAREQINEYSTGVYSNRLVNIDERELILDINAYAALAGISSYTEQEELCNTCRQVKSYCIPLEQTYLEESGSTTVYNLDGSIGLTVEWDLPWDWKKTAQANMGAWYGLQGALNCEKCLLAGCYPMWESRPSNPFFETLADYVNDVNGNTVMSYSSQYTTYGNDFTYMAKNTYGTTYEEWASATSQVMKDSCKLETRLSSNLMNDQYGRNRLCSSESNCALCKYGHDWAFQLADLDAYIEDAFDGVKKIDNGCRVGISGTEYYVGWSCSPSGHGLQRSVFLDNRCQYPVSETSFHSIASRDDVKDFERAIGLMKLSSVIQDGISCDKDAPTVGSGIELRYGIDHNGHSVNVVSKSAYENQNEQDFYDAVSHPEPNTVCALINSGKMDQMYIDAELCKNYEDIEGYESSEIEYEVDLLSIRFEDYSTLCNAIKHIPLGRSQGSQELNRGSRAFESNHWSSSIDMILILVLSIVACLGMIVAVAQVMKRRSIKYQRDLRTRLVLTKHAFESETDSDISSDNGIASDETSVAESCWNPRAHKTAEENEVLGANDDLENGNAK